MVGYLRAVRVGNTIEVAGTTSMDGDLVVGKDNVYAQSVFIFQKIAKALQQLGSSLADVVSTRMFVTNIADWELVSKAHGELFKIIRPVAAMVQVSKLIDDDLLIEIELTAIAEL